MNFFKTAKPKMSNMVMAHPSEINSDAQLHVTANMVDPDQVIKTHAHSIHPNVPVGQQPTGEWLALHQKKKRQNTNEGIFAMVSPIDLKNNALLPAVNVNDVKSDAYLNVSAADVHPDTLVTETDSGTYATIASSDLGDVVSGKQLQTVNKLPKDQFKTLTSPSMVSYNQPIVVQAEHVLNSNAMVIPYNLQIKSKAIPLGTAYKKGLRPTDLVVVAACQANPGNVRCQVPLNTSQLGPEERGLTARQLPAEHGLTATQPAVQNYNPNFQVSDVPSSQLNPDAVLKVNQTMLAPNVPVYYPMSPQVEGTQKQVLVPFTKNAARPASALPGQTVVQVPARFVQPSQYVQARSAQLKQNINVVHAPASALQPGVQFSTTNQETTPYEPQYTTKALGVNPNGQQQQELRVQATQLDLKQNVPVIVQNKVIQKDQQGVRVTQEQSLVRPDQLRKDVKFTVPVSQVKPETQLVQVKDQQGGGFYTVRAAQMKSKGTQRGGAGSDFTSSFYANTVVGGPAAISAATLQGIDNAPMFHPLDYNAVIPTLDSTGIVPSGLFMATNWPNMIGGGYTGYNGYNGYNGYTYNPRSARQGERKRPRKAKALKRVHV